MSTWIAAPEFCIDSPNVYPEGHKYVRPIEAVVLHYTVGYLAPRDDVRPGSVRWLVDPAAKASAHFVLDRHLWQLAPLEARTWHAGGPARWRGGYVNGKTIGIEISNVGLLFQTSHGLFDHWDREFRGDAFRMQVSDFGRIYGSEGLAVLRRLHEAKDLELPQFVSFAPFPAWQIRRLAALLEELADRFPILREGGDRLTTHAECAPTIKIDPGPALNWRLNRWREEIRTPGALSTP